MTTAAARLRTRATGPPRARRDTQQPMIGGVAAGLARHLGAAGAAGCAPRFVVAAALGGLGVAFYAGLWLVLPADSRVRAGARPASRARRRGGRRPGADPPARPTSARRSRSPRSASARCCCVEARPRPGRGLLAGRCSAWSASPCCGARPTRRSASAGSTPPAGSTRCGWCSAAAAGRRTPGSPPAACCSCSRCVLFALRGGSVGDGPATSLSRRCSASSGWRSWSGPWVYRLASDLTAERAERVRTQERADVAAHLHDSVLQTLALIQKNAGDGAAVARLARAQERDLRTWLFAGESDRRATPLAGALRARGRRGRGRPRRRRSRWSRVGDCDLDRARCARSSHATREAVANAAKHAGTGRVDVYAEVSPRRGRRVRPRPRPRLRPGRPSPTDRHGVRHSIIDRMRAPRRHRRGPVARPARAPRCACTCPAAPDPTGGPR